jgi:hypothetical protein
LRAITNQNIHLSQHKVTNQNTEENTLCPVPSDPNIDTHDVSEEIPASHAPVERRTKPKQNFKIPQNQTGFSSTTYPGVCVALRGFEAEILRTNWPTEPKTFRRPEPKTECRTVTYEIHKET